MERVNITLPDGSVKEFDKGITPYQVADTISGRLASDALVAKVNDNLWDLHRPVNSDSNLSIHTFKDPIGKETYWHSTSHLMAHAVLEIYPEAKFGVGPAVEGGFYYDIDINSQLSDADLSKIEHKMEELSKNMDTPVSRKSGMFANLSN